MDAVLLSFAVVFVAELGDKSQLVALALATRHRAVPVLVGIAVATAGVHLGSVALGAAVGAALPTGPITVAAGVAFFGFAWWTWRGDELGADERSAAERSARSVVAAVTAAFFLAELGDKTMLATVALATREGAVGTWVGSTVGMVAADALAIAVGRLLGRRLPEQAIRLGATASFLALGALLVAEGLPG